MNERRHTGKPSFHNVKRRCAGETISELLYSMLVAALAVLILTGAVTSAAKVDARARQTIAKRGEPDFLPESFSAPAPLIRLTRSDGVELVSPVSMTLQKVDGKNLYRYDAP